MATSKNSWIINRNSFKRLGLLLLLIVAALFWCQCSMMSMPGKSHTGDLPPLTDEQHALAARLRSDVEHLASAIGPRSVFNPEQLHQAEEWLAAQLAALGYQVKRQTYTVDGVECTNVEVEIPGSTHRDEIIVIGAHYDSCLDTPAANDNGSGVAVTLELARLFSPERSTTSPHVPPPARTVRFVLFVNEEPPWFQTADMGSRVYAKRCRERSENIVAMISLETMGYYSDEPKSQQYPIGAIGLLYPDRGNFIAFVGNYSSRGLVKQAIKTFRATTPFPSEGAALPGWIAGVGWSDHWAFWEEGYPGIMLTDTAPFRYPHYHMMSDTPEKLDYSRLARVAQGVVAIVNDLAAHR